MYKTIRYMFGLVTALLLKVKNSNMFQLAKVYIVSLGMKKIKMKIYTYN
jgi:hypothetical protein